MVTEDPFWSLKNIFNDRIQSKKKKRTRDEKYCELNIQKALNRE